MARRTVVCERAAEGARIAAVILLVAGAMLIAAPAAAAAVTFTVETVLDNPDSNVGDGACSDGTNGCTLRAALQEANADAGTQTINFNLPPSSLFLDVAQVLPSIADPVVVDGTTQPGGAPIIRNTGAVDYGMFVGAGGGGSRLRGLQVQGFDIAGLATAASDTLIVGNVLVDNNRGVDVSGSNNELVGNYVGTSDGTTAYANDVGVFLTGDNNTVGGSGAGSGNVVSGNAGPGVEVYAGSTGNVMLGNVIGATAAGHRALPNAGAGVLIVGGSNTIGPDNLISGNTGAGVHASGSQATGNTVQGNFIGTDASGRFALPNGNGGVFLDSSPGNTVGPDNLISGNTGAGVTIGGQTAPQQASSNTLVGNLIGTDATGGAALGNGGGVSVEAAPGNTIGGSAPESRNVISGNAGDGVTFIFDGATGNAMLGNYVGTDVTGAAAVANSGNGVFVDAPGDVVGAPGAGNVISGNVQRGVWVSGGPGGSATIQANKIGTNAAGDTALGNGSDGILLADAPNNLIGGAVAGAGNLVSGNGADGVDVTASSTGTGQGNQIRGNLIGTDAAGAAALPNGLDGVHVNDVATTLVGGTSAGARNVISGNAHDGVQISGVDATSTRVQGNYIGTDSSGTATVGNGNNGLELAGGASTATIGGTVTGAGNVISGNFNGIVLGTATSATRVQGNMIGTNSSGAAILGNALEGIKIDHATGNTVGGTTATARNVISGNTDGIRISGDGLSTPMDNAVLDNYIGTDASGGVDLGNGGTGVFLDNAPGNTIGQPRAGNVVSGNGDHGIRLLDTNSIGNLVQANDVGTDASGAAALGNGIDGVFIDNAPTNTIGGTAPGSGNVISANGANGVEIARSAATGNLVQGNRIGTQAGADLPRGNGQAGVRITGGAHHETVNANNRIAFNAKQGVLVASGTRTVISRNAIFDNGALGIDLTPVGVTANDPGDPDPGPNGRQNYPVLTSASHGASTTTMTGAMNSHPTTTYQLQFFAQPSCDPTGFGEGKRFLGTATVTTDASGNAGFTATLPATVPIGQSVTATATDPNKNTSEFSACRTIS